MKLVFTGYNRPRYFAPVLDSWAEVRGFADCRPELFLEPSPVSSTMAGIAAAQGVCVHHNPRRHGVLHNPWVALESAFADGAEFVILAEDDVLVSTDTVEFFGWADHEFRDEHILAVCACSYRPFCPPEHEQTVIRSQRFSPLVWGTWRDRWYDVLRDSWDHDYSSGTPHAPQSGWDWNINLRVMADWEVISPLASRSTHIGMDMGTHTTVASFPDSVARTFRGYREPAAFGPIEQA